MPEQLQTLKALQTLDRERRDLLQQREQLDKEAQGLQGEVDRLQGMIDILAADLEARQEQRRELVGRLEHERGLASRAEARLPQIKTQREYLAVLKEVDGAKKQIKELTDQLTAVDGEIAGLDGDRAEKDGEIAAVNEQTAQRRSEIEAAVAELDGSLGEREQRREALTAGLPTPLRKRYELLMERRAGLAVVEARNGACLGCHMHLPPQLFNRLYTAKEVLNCPHCNRLLYLGEG